MKVRFLARANRELTAATNYYSKESMVAASRFLDEIEESLSEIRVNPTLYRKYRSDIRVKLLAGFPYSIYYKIKPQEIVIVAVSHHSRRPDYWQNRA